MFWLSGNRMRLVVVGIVAAMAVGGTSAKADFTFGQPTMYIDSNRSGGHGDYDLWVLKRASPDEEWGSPENLGPQVNSSYEDCFACISADGLTLYFQSKRPGAYGSYDIQMTTRPTRNDPWGLAVSMPVINGPWSDLTPWITADGLEFYISSWRPGGYGLSDLWVAKRKATDTPWSEPVNLGPSVNSEYHEQYVSLSRDGLLLLFADVPAEFGPPVRPGGYGDADIWMTRRASVFDPWQTPMNLGPQVNGPGIDYAPRISLDQSTLHFFGVHGAWGNWQAPILPIVDFNGDGNTDTSDMVMLIDGWGTDDTLYDIGPMPWGDGVVDVEDLKVFIEYWEQSNRPLMGENMPANP